VVLLGFWMDGLGSVAVGGVSVGLEPGSEVASLRAKGTGGLHDGGSEDSKRGSFWAGSLTRSCLLRFELTENFLPHSGLGH
jgi:hypothetical protein